MTTTSAMPVLRAAPTGASPVSTAGPSGRAGAPQDLATAFAAMVDALTTELEAVAGEADGEAPVEPAADAAEPAEGHAPDDRLASALAGSVTRSLQAAPAATTAPAATPAGAVDIDAVAIGEVSTGRAVEAEAVAGRAGGGAVTGQGPTGEVVDGEGLAGDAVGKGEAAAAGHRAVVAAHADITTRAGQAGGPGRTAVPVSPATGATADAVDAGADGAALRDGHDAMAAADPAAPVSATPPAGAASTPAAGAAAVPVGVAPVAPVVAVDGPAPAAPVAPTAPPAVPEQLVTLVAPLRRAPDGTHQMSLQLRPEELGGVTVDVRVLGNQISLHLRADVPATSDLLRASLADLRVDLEAAGFDAGSLDVGANGHEAPRGDDRDAPRPGPASTAPRVVTGAVTTSAAAPAAGIDIRL